MKSVRDWYRAQLTEIHGETRLSLYGAFLCFTHIMTRFWWASTFRNPPNIGLLEAPICWSFVPHCERFRLAQPYMSLIGEVYLVAAALGIWYFFTRKTTAAWWTLFGLTIFKYLLLLTDYNLMGNFHYMSFIICFLFLLVPAKARLNQLMIVLFYVSAGTLKLNYEWLSGAASNFRPEIPRFILEWLFAFAMFFELILIWGLLDRRSWIRWGTLGLVAFFHVFSLWVVGFYYPVIMSSLLTIFPLFWLNDISFSQLPKHSIHFLIIGLFVLAQLIPHFQSGDPALEGRGRVFALNMYDANTRCFASLFLRYKDSIYEIKPSDTNYHSALRTQCDPVVIWNIANWHCDRNRSRADFVDLDILMTTRRLSDATFHPLISYENFCSRRPPYSILFASEWTQ